MGVTPAGLYKMTQDDPEQLDLMIAYLEYETEKGSHGQPMGEATDPRADPNYYGDDSFGYVAHATQDWAQNAIEVEKKRLRTENPEVDLGDRIFTVERVDYGTVTDRTV